LRLRQNRRSRRFGRDGGKGWNRRHADRRSAIDPVARWLSGRHRELELRHGESRRRGRLQLSVAGTLRIAGTIAAAGGGGTAGTDYGDGGGGGESHSWLPRYTGQPGADGAHRSPQQLMAAAVPDPGAGAGGTRQRRLRPGRRTYTQAAEAVAAGPGES
jgi:hypothetical protein